MKKLWSYIASALAGMIVGIITGVMILRNKVSNVSIGKQKIRGTDNTMSNKYDITTARGTKRAERKKKRLEKRLARVNN